MNRMTVSKLFARENFFDVPAASGSVAPENFHNLLEFALLATKLDPFDPMEKAIKESADHLLRRRSTYTRVGIWCHWCPVVDEANPFNSFYKF